MRWRFAVALGAALAALAVFYWQSGHMRGVEHVKSRPIEPFGDMPSFGGISAVELRDDGTGYLMSDRGALFDVHFGKLGALEIENARPLTDAEGGDLERAMRDSEGLALMVDGRLAVSFEWRHRVELYHPDGRLSEVLPKPEGFDALQSNSGLEALAVAPDGALMAIPERSGHARRPFPVFVCREGSWAEAELPRRGAFLPVGADFGPDGRLYLLERDFFLSGFRSRIRRFDWDGLALSNEQELLKTRFWAHGNLEGISVRASGPETMIELVSDNNFLSITPHEFVSYRVIAP